jgi:hypothetical protein
MSDKKIIKRPARIGTFESQYEAWRRKIDRRELGINNVAGKWVIIYSCFGEPELGTLRTHAQALADKWASQRDSSMHVDIAANPSYSELVAIIQDEYVSTVAFIGHGSLSAVRQYDARRWNSVGWYKFGEMAGVLKQGVFEQRTCAMVGDSSQVRIPSGTFVMSDPRNLRAAVNHYFEDTAGFDEFERHLKPVYTADGSDRDVLLAPVSQPI